MTEQTPYPVRVDATLDEPLSRWLWLVKWILLIPHFFVLVFLWLAFAVVTVIAWFAILFTAKYPRALFDFNLGVLRWSWRVHYYGYAALGTDRYPPFTLDDVPDYPARLDVPYPEELSRGLVLVKSWLLALPHWLVVAVFAGGGLWIGQTAADGSRWDGGWGAGGLIGLLVLIAGIVMLFTDRYPRSLYDFVLGMDRWVLRVAAYVSLMTDRYPPFRLDMGGRDPGHPVLDPSPVDGPLTYDPTEPVGVTPSASTAGAWTAGRVGAVVIGAILLFAGTGMLVGGSTLAYADTTQRDDGYVMSPDRDFATDSYALTMGDIVLEGAGLNWTVDVIIGDARVEVTPADGREIFVGLAPTSDVADYLRDTEHLRIQNFGPIARASERERPGGAPPAPPGDLDIWEAQAQGSGPQTMIWTPAAGDWTVVVMNADASPGLDVEARIGATAPGLVWLWITMLVIGVVALAVGALLIALSSRRANSQPATPTERDSDQGRSR